MHKHQTKFSEELAPSVLPLLKAHMCKASNAFETTVILSLKLGNENNNKGEKRKQTCMIREQTS